MSFLCTERDELIDHPEYAGLLAQACPAAVYEYTEAEGADADAAGKKFVINSQVSFLDSRHG